MKFYLVPAVLFLACTVGHAEVEPYARVARMLGPMIIARPSEYKVSVVYLSDSTHVDGGAFSSFSDRIFDFRFQVPADRWEKEVSALLDSVSDARRAPKAVPGDYRLGVEILGSWGERPMRVFLDERARVAEINGIACTADDALIQWFHTHVDPVISHFERLQSDHPPHVSGANVPPENGSSNVSSGPRE